MVCKIFMEFWWTFRVVWSLPAMFLTSAMCRSRDLFGRWWNESMATAAAVSYGASVATTSILQNTHNFTFHFAVHLVLYHFAISHNTDIRRQTWTSMKKQTSTSATLGNWGKPCLCFGQEPVWQESSVCFVCVLFLCVVDSNLSYYSI